MLRRMKKGHWILTIVLGIIIVTSGLFHHFPAGLFIGAFIASFAWTYMEK